MNRLKSYYSNLSKENKGRLVVVGITMLIIALLIAIALILSIDNKSNMKDSDGLSVNKNTEQSDYIKLSDIIIPINSGVSEIRVVSNENNEQAELMLNTVGLELNELTSYAASIDAKHDSAHAIVVTKPKPGSYTLCKKSLVEYIANKQRVLIESEKMDTKEYENTLNAVVYEHDDYLILVMEDNSQTILDEIVMQLDSRSQQSESKEN